MYHFQERDYYPTAEVSEVIEAIVKRRLDPDGVSNWAWVSAILIDDAPHEIIEYILKNKDEPAIEPLYQILYAQISGILDKP
jgi:hypothetical protein